MGKKATFNLLEKPGLLNQKLGCLQLTIFNKPGFCVLVEVNLYLNGEVCVIIFTLLVYFICQKIIG